MQFMETSLTRLPALSLSSSSTWRSATSSIASWGCLIKCQSTPMVTSSKNDVNVMNFLLWKSYSSSSSSSCTWVAWTRNLIAYSDMMTMAVIALTRCIYITCSKVNVILFSYFSFSPRYRSTVFNHLVSISWLLCWQAHHAHLQYADYSRRVWQRLPASSPKWGLASSVASSGSPS